MIPFLIFHTTLSLDVKMLEIIFFKNSYLADFFLVFQFFNLPVKQLTCTQFLVGFFIRNFLMGEAYLGHYQISMLEPFAKIILGF